MGGENGSSSIHCFHGSSRQAFALGEEELGFKGERTLCRYLLLKSKVPAGVDRECAGLSSRTEVCFTLNVPGRILNTQIGVSYGIFPRP